MPSAPVTASGVATPLPKSDDRASESPATLPRVRIPLAVSPSLNRTRYLPVVPATAASAATSIGCAVLSTELVEPRRLGGLPPDRFAISPPALLQGCILQRLLLRVNIATEIINLKLYFFELCPDTCSRRPCRGPSVTACKSIVKSIGGGTEQTQATVCVLMVRPVQRR
jgi:hypothetical protein